MIALAGPLPPPLPRDLAPSSFASRRPSNQPLNLARLKHPPAPRPSAFDSDSDDDDEVDEPFPFDSFDDMCFDGSKQPPKLPLSKVPRLKKAVKVVAKKSGSDLKNTRKSELRDYRASRDVNSTFSDFDPKPMRLADLNSAQWEKQAYEIVRRQKLRRSLAAQEIAKQPTEMQERTSAKQPTEMQEKASPTQLSSVEVKEDPVLRQLAGLELQERCRPLVEYLLSLGLDEVHLERIAKRRRLCFQIRVTKVRERVEYLTSLGVKVEDLGKIIVRHPQVLEYTVEHMMKPRIQFLQSIGVPDAKLGRVITVAPSLLECSLEKCLKRRVQFLLEEVGVSEDDVWKVVVLSPQVLTQSIEDSLRPRLNYFVKKLGASRARVAKMITKHPQLFHYSITDGIQPRIDFLRSIGMSDPDIVIVLSRSSQILSLSVENSLKPKSDYLMKELKCGVQAVTSFPAYFSLSLEQRIQPRHKFLKSLKRLPEGPFPMHLLAIRDQEFCKWAKSTVDEYNAFREKMLLDKLAKKFERRNRLQFEYH